MLSIIKSYVKYCSLSLLTHNCTDIAFTALSGSRFWSRHVLLRGPKLQNSNCTETFSAAVTRHKQDKVTVFFFIGLLEMRLGLPKHFLRQQPCILAFFLFKTNIMQFLSFQRCDCLYYEVTSLNYLFLILVLLHNVLITLIYNIFFLSIYFYVRFILYPRATSHTYSCTVHVTLFNKV